MIETKNCENCKHGKDAGNKICRHYAEADKLTAFEEARHKSISGLDIPYWGFGDLTANQCKAMDDFLRQNHDAIFKGGWDARSEEANKEELWAETWCNEAVTAFDKAYMAWNEKKPCLVVSRDQAAERMARYFWNAGVRLEDSDPSSAFGLGVLEGEQRSQRKTYTNAYEDGVKVGIDVGDTFGRREIIEKVRAWTMENFPGGGNVWISGTGGRLIEFLDKLEKEASDGK